MVNPDEPDNPFVLITKNNQSMKIPWKQIHADVHECKSADDLLKRQSPRNRLKSFKAIQEIAQRILDPQDEEYVDLSIDVYTVVKGVHIEKSRRVIITLAPPRFLFSMPLGYVVSLIEDYFTETGFLPPEGKLRDNIQNVEL